MKLAFNRKIVLAAGVATLPFLVPASSHATDDPAKVYYNDGMRFETKEVDLKLNVLLQPGFTFTDYDHGHDVDDFDVRRAQFVASGNLLNKQFSFELRNEFRNTSDGLEDAWLQWNCDCNVANLRMGQFKTPFSRGTNIDDQGLEFITRSFVNEFFSFGRNQGAMVHGEVVDGVHYYLNVFNGQSTDEGLNHHGDDNNVALAAAVTAQTMGYGSRAFEGDLRDHKDSMDFTGGISSVYGQGNTLVITDPLNPDPNAKPLSSDFKKFDLNGDVGMRFMGWSAQGEMYYSHLKLDDTDATFDNFGFYVQGGYLFTKNMEVAGRFGYLNFDKDFNGINSEQEYDFVFNYYMKGHSLKWQTGVAWLNTSFQDSSSGDTTDFRVMTQLTGYL